MTGTYTTFVWEFVSELRERLLAEAELKQVGRPGDHTWLLTVTLVRDVMAAPTEAEPLLDPENRVGKRVYVTTLRSREDDRVRLLAYLAPVEGHRVAYTLIYEALRKHQDAVRKFGYEWLTNLMAEEPKRSVRRKASA
jgi:hypothetical protein